MNWLLSVPSELITLLPILALLVALRFGQEDEMHCHRCDKEDEQADMWPDGYTDESKTEEMYLCQDCHEAEVDAAWWAIVTSLEA